MSVTLRCHLMPAAIIAWRITVYVTTVNTTHATPPRFKVPPFPEPDVVFGVLLTLQPADQPRVSCWSRTELQSLSRPQQPTSRSARVRVMSVSRRTHGHSLRIEICARRSRADVPSSKAGRPSAVPKLYACQETLVLLPSLPQPLSSFIS